MENDKRNSGKNRTYEVGKGRTPLHTRWKPGQSGNPTGRKKGQLNQKTMIAMVEAEFLESEATVTGSYGQRKIPKIQAIVMNLANKATAGENKAITDALALAWHIAKLRSEAEPETGSLEEDLAICRQISAELYNHESDE